MKSVRLANQLPQLLLLRRSYCRCNVSFTVGCKIIIKISSIESCERICRYMLFNFQMLLNMNQCWPSGRLFNPLFLTSVFVQFSYKISLLAHIKNSWQLGLWIQAAVVKKIRDCLLGFESQILGPFTTLVMNS